LLIDLWFTPNSEPSREFYWDFQFNAPQRRRRGIVLHELCNAGVPLCIELAARRRLHPPPGTAALLRHGVGKSFPLVAITMPAPARHWPVSAIVHFLDRADERLLTDELDIVGAKTGQFLLLSY
jgi:hypothetical protein